MQTTVPSCPRCGTELSAGISPGGLCPRCLLQLGFDSQAGSTQAQAAGSGPRRDPAPSPEELAPRFPELEIEALVGRGGMGCVYRARQRGLDRPVALKILTHEAARDPAWPERFAREARALALLSHPNIVTVFDSGAKDGLYYLLMEFVAGTSLRNVIQARDTTPAQALAIVGQLCDALQYAHEEGVVHRDIKPENILFDARGRVKIADFGLAKLAEAGGRDPSLTGTQQTIGTPQYMAPEQIESPERVDSRADLYSLGVVFYELLTGELPIGRFAPPSRKVDVDAGLDEVVLKTLAKEPSLRYQHASHIKTDVEGVSRKAERAAEEREADARDEPEGRLGRRLRRISRRTREALDPRTASRKRVGGTEVPSSWPLAMAAFLVLCLFAALTGSPWMLFTLLVVAVVGLVALIQSTA